MVLEFVPLILMRDGVEISRSQTTEDEKDFITKFFKELANPDSYYSILQKLYNNMAHYNDNTKPFYNLCDDATLQKYAKLANSANPSEKIVVEGNIHGNYHTSLLLRDKLTKKELLVKDTYFRFYINNQYEEYTKLETFEAKSTSPIKPIHLLVDAPRIYNVIYKYTPVHLKELYNAESELLSRVGARPCTPVDTNEIMISPKFMDADDISKIPVHVLAAYREYIARVNTSKQPKPQRSLTGEVFSGIIRELEPPFQLPEMIIHRTPSSAQGLSLTAQNFIPQRTIHRTPSSAQGLSLTAQNFIPQMPPSIPELPTMPHSTKLYRRTQPGSSHKQSGGYKKKYTKRSKHSKRSVSKKN